jgi:hypothetical protein
LAPQQRRLRSQREQRFQGLADLASREPVIAKSAAPLNGEQFARHQL